MQLALAWTLFITEVYYIQMLFTVAELIKSFSNNNIGSVLPCMGYKGMWVPKRVWFKPFCVDCVHFDLTLGIVFALLS